MLFICFVFIVNISKKTGLSCWDSLLLVIILSLSVSVKFAVAAMLKINHCRKLDPKIDARIDSKINELLILELPPYIPLTVERQ